MPASARPAPRTATGAPSMARAPLRAAPAPSGRSSVAATRPGRCRHTAGVILRVRTVPTAECKVRKWSGGAGSGSGAALRPLHARLLTTTSVPRSGFDHRRSRRAEGHTAGSYVGSDIGSSAGTARRARPSRRSDRRLRRRPQRSHPRPRRRRSSRASIRRGHDVLDDEDAIGRVERKATTKRELAVLLARRRCARRRGRGPSRGR